ncbi:MAG: sensor histidine kinase [Oscillospiraceae bacterium]
MDFLRTASHELKTPVTELNATLENMILGIGEYRDYETYLPKCKEITEQLGDMIRDILNASRLQTQGNNEPCSNFSLRTLLTELCEPYRLIAEAKGIKFKIELSSDAFVYLPEGRLKKAISNILSNAVNYTEAGQSISVVFDKNKLSVSNECSVLPPEQLQHIFEPFYRPDLAHSQATGGNGLGLYIVQTILDKLRLKYQFVPMPNDRGMSFTHTVLREVSAFRFPQEKQRLLSFNTGTTLIFIIIQHRRCTMSAKGGKTPTTKMKEVKSMAKKIGIIVLLCFSLCVGGVSAFANEGHDETDTQTLIETQPPVSSVLFRQDGADIQQSTDEGKTWQSYSPIEETDYFTYDEFSAWIENETENIQKLVDAGEWTEAEATEALEYYDEILKSILEGAKW